MKRIKPLPLGSTFKDIVNKLEECELTTWDMEMGNDKKSGIPHNIFGTIKVHYGEHKVKQDGPEQSIVIHFKKFNIYLRDTGSVYVDGTTDEWFGKFEQVFPRRVIKTVYETAKQRGKKTDEDVEIRYINRNSLPL